MQKSYVSKTILGIVLTMSVGAVAQTTPVLPDQTPPGLRIQQMESILTTLEMKKRQIEFIENNLILKERRLDSLTIESRGITRPDYREVSELRRDIRESHEIKSQAQATVNGILNSIVAESGVLQSEFAKTIDLRVLPQDAVNGLYETGDRDPQARKQHLIANLNGETKIFVGPEYVSIPSKIHSPAGTATIVEFYEYKTVYERPHYDQSLMLKRTGEFLRFNFGHAGIASAGAGVATISSLGDQIGSERVVKEILPMRYFSYESASQGGYAQEKGDSKVDSALRNRKGASSLRLEAREAVRKVERK